MARKIFLGIGCGPIQTGIFISGAHKAGFEKIIIAEVNPVLVEKIRQAGSITINISTNEGVKKAVFDRVEIYNPFVEEDLEVLKKYAAEADVLNTALPGTKFYPSSAKWLKEAFARNPEKTHYFYTSENSTTAADDLHKAMGDDFPKTYYLDTVIGKMSKIFKNSENDYPVLAPGLEMGHLVEEFNEIYSSDAPGLEEAAPAGVYAKADLGPFEEAKLYGHNASHFVLGLALSMRGCGYMSEGTMYPEVMKEVRDCLIHECGQALCKKYAGFDPYFEMGNFTVWADELIQRMVSSYLTDSVERIIRDLDRKLGYADRSIGAIRLCLSQGVEPTILIRYARFAASRWAFQKLSEDWPDKQLLKKF
ncbi:MAG: hypothetical protein WCS73_08655 [Lentisphaeria bacterium]